MNQARHDVVLDPVTWDRLRAALRRAGVEGTTIAGGVLDLSEATVGLVRGDETSRMAVSTKQNQGG